MNDKFELTTSQKDIAETIKAKDLDWRASAPEWLAETGDQDIKPELREELEKIKKQLDDVLMLAAEDDVEFLIEGINPEDGYWQVQDELITQETHDFNLKQQERFNTPFAKLVTWGRDQGALTTKEADELLSSLIH
jgi:hypothetical protein